MTSANQTSSAFLWPVRALFSIYTSPSNKKPTAIQEHNDESILTSEDFQNNSPFF